MHANDGLTGAAIHGHRTLNLQKSSLRVVHFGITLQRQHPVQPVLGIVVNAELVL